MPVPSLNRVRAAPFRKDESREGRGYSAPPTGVNAWKVRLAVAALVVTLGWAAVAFVLWPTHLHAVCTHGELAGVHAPWADRCDACHVPYGDPACQGGNGLYGCGDRWRSFRCETCHPGPPGDAKNYSPHYDLAGPRGGHLTDDARARDCAGCHRDHQGKDFALTRVADAKCSQCHQDKSQLYPKSPPDDPLLAVTGFHTDHPEFAVVRGPTPERPLKFNHGLHLALGLVENEYLNKHDIQFTLEKVAPAYKEQYRRFADAGSPVAALKLDCSACHQLSGGPAQPPDPRAGGAARLPGANLTTVPGDGAYYLPVTFEQHCQGCHQLNLTPAPSEAGVNMAGFQVPHRLRRSEVEDFVRGEVTRQVEARDKLFPQVLLPPNDRLDPRPLVVPPTLKSETDKLVKLYTKMLYDDPSGVREKREPGDKPQPTMSGGHSCYKCHRVGADREVLPTRGLTLWMPKARFNHAAHKAMNCAECHNTWERDRFKRYAYEPDKPDEPVNIVGGIDNCRRCHAPAGFKVNYKPDPDKPAVEFQSPGVRHDCVTCHRFHRGDRPLPGTGSPHHDPAARDRLKAHDLIRGIRP